MNRLRLGAFLVAPFSLSAVALACAQTTAESVPMSVLKQCAAINSTAERVACYDKLAGRAPATASSRATAPTAEAPAAAPAPKESFGLYTAEHPKAPAVERLSTGQVISIGSNSRGRVTVTLSGDQVWELDSADPVLANGDTVTIQRGALGSFILTTPAGRIHRVHRMR
jgi:hypothetical protein